jgi:hypothetical protein
VSEPLPPILQEDNWRTCFPRLPAAALDTARQLYAADRWRVPWDAAGLVSAAYDPSSSYENRCAAMIRIRERLGR